jgi:P27 family predicted phage terminase small subunit
MTQRKSKDQKMLEGTNRKDREVGIYIPALEKMPDPSPKLGLSKEAKDLRLGYGNQLIAEGLLTFLDLITFDRYCVLWDRARIMKNDIDKDGYFQETKTGYQQVRPCVGVLNTCETEMLKIEDRFGLSPHSRSKIPAKKEDKENPFLKRLKEMEEKRRLENT